MSLKNCENFMRVSYLVSEKIEVKVFVIFSTSVELEPDNVCLSVCVSEPKNFWAQLRMCGLSDFFVFGVFLKFGQNSKFFLKILIFGALMGPNSPKMDPNPLGRTGEGVDHRFSTFLVYI